jgi:single-stranded-DNA-specific exonuclease
MADSLRAGRTLLVWGDYDVDGITSTALVVEFMERHGFAARHHIPSRLEEGYGLTVAAVERLAAEGVGALLTVDCGISDVEAVARARELGLTVIVSDHHLPGDSLPPAHAICNPRLGASPCPDLAGVGVAFMLMATLNAVFAERGKERVDMRDFLDLAALGTLADVVELSGQNRILVKNGLLTIASGRRPGLAALKSVCNQSPTGALEATQVVFQLAPRINAAGRLGQSDVALRLLLTRDRDEATRLALRLDELNTARREEEKQIQTEAAEQAEIQAGIGRMGLVLHAPHWHPGIIGIVASRIVEKYHRPAVVLCDDRGAVKGSGRSVAAFDLHGALTECAELFRAFGGHRQAAGVTLAPESLPAFSERFNEIALRELGHTPSPPLVLVDDDLSFAAAADFTCLKELELLQPFGPGNPEPVFISPPVRVASVQSKYGGLTVAALTHEESGITLKAKIWKETGAIPQHMRGAAVRLAYTPRIDRYNGAAQVELKLRDWQTAGGNQ